MFIESDWINKLSAKVKLEKIVNIKKINFMYNLLLINLKDSHTYK